MEPFDLPQSQYYMVNPSILIDELANSAKEMNIVG
jgi:hypothetical protein